MTDDLSEAELNRIEHRATKAAEAAPRPWRSFLETRQGIGGSSFIRVGDDTDIDYEMYIDGHIGPEQLSSPDVRLDAIIDFVAHAVEDVPRLLTEIRSLRGRST